MSLIPAFRTSQHLLMFHAINPKHIASHYNLPGTLSERVILPEGSEGNLFPGRFGSDKCCSIPESESPLSIADPSYLNELPADHTSWDSNTNMQTCSKPKPKRCQPAILRKGLSFLVSNSHTCLIFSPGTCGNICSCLLTNLNHVFSQT